MELIYSAMLLHSAKQQITEANVKRVLEAAGVKKSDVEIKALVSALSTVDIEKAIKEAAFPVAGASAPAGAQVSAHPEKKDEKKEEKKAEEESASGLGALFG